MNKIILEKDIAESIKPIPIKSLEIILEQMKKCVCKIHSGKTKGTGFFTKIHFKNSFLPVLITNNHILGINDIMNGRNITISLNNEVTFKNILIDEKRKRYTNEILDVTIIELNEKKDDIKYFLTLDDQILSGFNSKNTGQNNYFNNIYQNESLYLLNYLRGEEIFVSYGLLESIQMDEINHKCSTDKGSSGSPILLLKSNKVIGVHHGNIKSDSKFNVGKLLVKPLIDFQNIQNISNNFLAITKESSLKINYLNKNSSIKINRSMDISNINNKNINNININTNNIPKHKNINSFPFVGLDNIGATPYMNSTLQCLCNIKSFVEYFKHNKRLINIVNEDTKKEKLCSSFKLLIENLIPNQNMPKKFSYSPVEFKNKISLMNPLGVAANDAKDLVNFLLMTLHEELNTQIANQLDNNFGDMLEDQKNKEKLFNKFIQNFAQNYRSVISDLFYAFNCIITQCGNCKTIIYNYEIYFFLKFPLEEVRKYKLQNNIQIMSNNLNNNAINNIIDIYDCFTYEQKINYMDGENMIYCNYCRQNCDASMQTLLTSGPKILIIILNRGKGIEYNIKINFYLELNLKNYIDMNNSNWKYELFGVIAHIGESGLGGNFIAYCKKDDYHQWFKFDDSIVKPVYNFQNEVLNNPMPCVLFYRLKE